MHSHIPAKDKLLHSFIGIIICGFRAHRGFFQDQVFRDRDNETNDIFILFYKTLRASRFSNIALMLLS